ncbi:MAG TPA: FIST N-terminal domain-containing protein [Mesorhizobium sp.]|nr:FIST N-terminal domain-containing protein [Mesorhizobium sp.]
MTCGRTAYACGIVALHGSDLSVNDFAAAIGREALAAEASFASIFFSHEFCEAPHLAEALRRNAPGLRYAACSTAGEVSPDGYAAGHILAVLFSDARFAVKATMFDALGSRSMDDMAARVAELRREAEACDGAGRGSLFALLLIDGLSRAEEAVTSALHWGLDDIPLVGGSAGDDLRFEKTTLILDGRTASDAAILMLVRSQVPFQVFKTDNFVPTSRKLVVTESNPDARRVVEFNAEPAAQAYAEAIGIDPQTLGPMSFASHPVVVRVGGEYYCRSIQKVHPDGSLTFFCAIDNGVVLTVAQPKGMVESTRDKLLAIGDRLGGIDLVLGFDCVLRRLDAENRQSFRTISQLYRDNRVIGFGTYGEQFRSMHLNQTLTGIAFGRAAEAAE